MTTGRPIVEGLERKHMVRMDIQTIMIGTGPVGSLVVLRPRGTTQDDSSVKLPIRIGAIEAAAISAGVDGSGQERPLTHGLMLDVIRHMGGSIDSIEIIDVRGTTFYAHLNISCESGRHIEVDARPSDAIALAVRARVPIFADEHVVERASMPDFDQVEQDEKRQELKDFHDFVEHLSPDDFK